MSYQTLIRENREGMSPSFSRIADFILDTHLDAAFLSTSDLGERLGLDPATVVRFAQSLGYRGYPELQDDVRSQIKDALFIRGSELTPPDTAHAAADAALDEVSEAVEQVKIALNLTSVVELAEQIGSASRILVIAEGPALPSAATLVDSIQQGNFQVSHVLPGISGLAKALYNADDGDLWVTIDISGGSSYLAPALREAHARGVKTAAIVGMPSLASTYTAGLVLAGRGFPDQTLQILAVQTILYTLNRSLQNLYPERYSGVNEAITSITSLLR